MFHSFCGLLLTRGRKPRWSMCALKRDQPTNQPRWPGQHSLFKHKRDYPLFGTTIWIQKGCPLLKSWFQGLLLCSLINGTECVWYGTYLDCSSKTHTWNFTQKRSSGTAASTSEDSRPSSAFLVVSGLLLSAFPKRRPKNKPYVTSSMDLLFLHGSFTWLGHLWKVFSPPYFWEELWTIKLYCWPSAQGWIHQMCVIGSIWGQWAMLQSRILPSYWQSTVTVANYWGLGLVLMISASNLFIFWFVHFPDYNNSAQSKRCTFFPFSSEATNHKLGVC